MRTMFQHSIQRMHKDNLLLENKMSVFVGKGGEGAELRGQQEIMGIPRNKERNLAWLLPVSLTGGNQLDILQVIHFFVTKLNRRSASQGIENSTCQDLMVMDLILIFTNSRGPTSGGDPWDENSQKHTSNQTHTAFLCIEFYLLQSSTF